MNGVNAEVFVVAEQKRAEIQRGAGRRGRPVLLKIDKGGEQLERIFLGNLRQAKPLGGAV